MKVSRVNLAVVLSMFQLIAIALATAGNAGKIPTDQAGAIPSQKYPLSPTLERFARALGENGGGGYGGGGGNVVGGYGGGGNGGRGGNGGGGGYWGGGHGSDGYYYAPPRQPMTCDKHPTVCRALGSPGPDCCWKKCVNTETDNLNCGWCGLRCGYGTTCCGGKCVNIMYDRENCGGCGKRCRRGSYCRYGMCSYGY